MGAGLGDCVISKKVFDALIEIVPNCVIDIFYEQNRHLAFAKAFYGDSKNLNRIVDAQEYKDIVQNYDAALKVLICHAIILDWVNAERLQAMSPKFFEALVLISLYNQKYVFSFGSIGTAVAFRNMILSRIMNQNWATLLSCAGALPIRDNKIKIPLSPDFKSKFDALKLDKYITIYTDIDQKEKTHPKVKA